MDKIDLRRAFKAPFADTDWVKKTLFGWLWMLLGVTAPAVSGAQLEYIRSVSEGREELPEWNDFGDKWVRGLPAPRRRVHLLPARSSILDSSSMVPASSRQPSGSGELGAASLAAGCACSGSVAVVYGVAVSVLFYGGDGQLRHEGRVRRVLRVRRDPGARARTAPATSTAWLWAIVVSFAHEHRRQHPVGAVRSARSSVPAVAYLGVMITAHLFGQWAAKSYGVAQVATPVGVPGYMPPAVPTRPRRPAPPAYAPPAAPAARAPGSSALRRRHRQLPRHRAAPAAASGRTACSRRGCPRRSSAAPVAPPAPPEPPPRLRHLLRAPRLRTPSAHLQQPRRPADIVGGPSSCLSLTKQEDPVATRSRRRRHRVQTGGRV